LKQGATEFFAERKTSHDVKTNQWKAQFDVGF